LPVRVPATTDAIHPTTPSWSEGFAQACRRHPDLVSVHESPRGRLALLLWHPLLPRPAERADWRREIDRIASHIVAELGHAGVHADMTVLQLRPLRDVAYVLRRWPCRYDAAPARRRELAALAEREIARSGPSVPSDEGAGSPPASGEPARRAAGAVEAEVAGWYAQMTPFWMGIEPRLRRTLILRTHQWLVESVFVPGAVHVDVLADLRPDGALALALGSLVPPPERERWRPWTDQLRRDLRRALGGPCAQPSEAWYRALFLMPCRVPIVRVPRDHLRTRRS
jgi:hypothetical protein